MSNKWNNKSKLKDSIESNNVKLADADLYLYTRIILRYQGPRKIYQWILAAKFPDDKSYYFEVVNEFDKLVPKISEEEPKNIESKTFLATVKTSPLEMIKLANNNKYNNKPYMMLVTNSQEWVLEILKELKVSYEQTVLVATAANGVGTDPDEVVDAKLLLFTRKLQDIALGYVSFQHWILAVKFPQITYYLDADNENDRLIPKVYIEQPDYDSVKSLATVQTSRRQMEGLVNGNKFNYKEYTTMGTNCQTWIEEILRPFKVSTSVPSAFQTVVVCGVGVSCLFGIPGVVASVLGFSVLNVLTALGSRSASRR